MITRIATGILFLVVAAMPVLPAGQASAAESGTFTGSWVANGKVQPFDFAKDREVGTFRIVGNLSLKDRVGEIANFWAECVGLSDSISGSSARCAWRSLDGKARVYSTISGQPLKEGVKVTGDIVGGSGTLKGVTGAFTFTWISTFFDKDQDIFTGYTQDFSGLYSIP